MNNEPVAWIANDADLPLKEDGSYWLYPKNPSKDNLYIPLYTHPVNTCKHGVDDGACKECYMESTHPVELTDEEIMDESFMAGLAVSKDTDVFLLEHDVEALVTFARAILRKAQEKC